MTTRFIFEEDGVEVASKTLTPLEVHCLKHDLEGSSGLWRWIVDALDGRINKCAKGLECEAMQKLRIDRGDIISTYLGSPDYESRTVREASQSVVDARMVSRKAARVAKKALAAARREQAGEPEPVSFFRRLFRKDSK